MHFVSSLNRIFLLLLLSLSAGFARAEEGTGKIFTLDEYKPMYFVMAETETKIELSFKVKLMDDYNMFFGYTQLMIWKLFQAGPYFKDINYNPEIFYRFYTVKDGREWLDFGPIEHESNGLGGLYERSWNRTYLRYHNQTTVFDDQKLFYSFKIWYAYDFDQYNKDITEYRGLYEAEFTLTGTLGKSWERSDLTFRLYPGGKSSVDPFEGGQELLWEIKAPHYPQFVIEMFHGTGEFLLAYNEHIFAVRAGIGF